MALLIAIESSRNFVSGASGFLQNQPEIMSRKRKIIIIIKKQNNNRSFRRSRKALIITKFFIHNFFIVHILVRHVEQNMFSYPRSIDWYKEIGPQASWLACSDPASEGVFSSFFVLTFLPLIFCEDMQNKKDAVFQGLSTDIKQQARGPPGQPEKLIFDFTKF